LLFAIIILTMQGLEVLKPIRIKLRISRRLSNSPE